MAVDPIWDFDKISSDTRTVDENLAGAEATNAMVAQVLADSVGKAPVITAPEDTHVALPGGLYWDGELLRTAQVRELTGVDEELLASVTGSLVQWLSAVLERAVVRIGDQEPTPAMIRRLLIGDRDELLLGIRIASFGRDITLVNVICPHCDASMDATIDLTTVDRVVPERPAARHEHVIPLRRGGVAVVRLPDGVAQELIFADDAGNPAQRNTKLLGYCLVSVRDASGALVPGEGDALAQSLGWADRQSIIRYLGKNQPGPKLDDIHFVHDACGEEVRLPLTLPELFRV